MYQIQRTTTFKRCIKKLQKKKVCFDPLAEALRYLQNSDVVPLPARLNFHALSGNLAGRLEIHIGGRNSNWVLVYEIDGNILRLIFTGTHDDMKKL